MPRICKLFDTSFSLIHFVLVLTLSNLQFVLFGNNRKFFIQILLYELVSYLGVEFIFVRKRYCSLDRVVKKVAISVHYSCKWSCFIVLWLRNFRLICFNMLISIRVQILRFERLFFSHFPKNVTNHKVDTWAYHGRGNWSPICPNLFFVMWSNYLQQIHDC